MISAEYFGRMWVPGQDNFHLNLPPQERLQVLGRLDACPNPTAIAEEFGLDRLIARYAECNLVGAYIMEEATKINPELATALAISRPRLPGENPKKGFDTKAVPENYSTLLYAGSTLPRYAAPRVAIEEFGRTPPWQIGDARVSTGQQIVRSALRESKDPIDFIVMLSRMVTEADADSTAVLGHTLAVENLDEGIVTEIRQTSQMLEIGAPRLWKHYLSLSPEERQMAGILPIEVTVEN